MFESSNQYVLNKKDKDAIVYRDSMGNDTRLTRDMFESEEDFLFWKAWSDADYHEEEKERHFFSDNTLYIEGLSEEVLTTSSPEDDLFGALIEAERMEVQDSLLERLKAWLTETTIRRMRLYYVEEMTFQEIALLEGVAPQSIYESIMNGKEKFLKKYRKTP